MRQHRQSLSASEQQQASERFARAFAAQWRLRGARHIGLFLAADGELDPLPGLLTLDGLSRQLYLPVLPKSTDAVLQFVRWQPGEALIPNRYGIGEPVLKRRALTPLWRLDLLLMPLVAFDDEGNRLGMGGGFYDRALANLQTRPHRPRLIGVAHAFQRVERLPTAPWDQPLDGVITG
ncbi:MAG: 5-formyltetrahydrofolate cyclo-ligase [Alcanivoracaceae bacterium]